MNRHFPLAFSLGDRTLLFMNSECITGMTLPSWKYYSGDLGRSSKEETLKKNLRVGQSEPLRQGTEFSIDLTLCSIKFLNLFYRWGVGVAQNKGGVGALIQGLKGPGKKADQGSSGLHGGNGAFLISKAFLRSDSSQLSFPITWQSVSSLLKTVSWHDFTSL